MKIGDEMKERRGRIKIVQEQDDDDDNLKADVDRLNIKTKGGRGLLQTEATYKAEIINIAEHVNTKYGKDQFLNIVKSHGSN